VVAEARDGASGVRRCGSATVLRGGGLTEAVAIGSLIKLGFWGLGRSWGALRQASMGYIGGKGAATGLVGGAGIEPKNDVVEEER
jgi:hypothetical protein